MNLSSLDVLALAGLPESELIPKLANKKLDQPFMMEDARILVRALVPDHGTLEKLARAIYEEVQRQRPIRVARRARNRTHLTRTEMQTMPATIKYSTDTPAGRARRAFAKKSLAEYFFLNYIENSFDEEILAMLELMTDVSSYAVYFLDVGSRPATSCVVKISANDNSRTTYNFLLYKLPGGKVRGVPTAADNVRDAWAEQVPEEAFELSELGYKFETNFEEQTMVGAHPDGDVIALIWRGRIDDL